jgi:hypothetical protein
VVKSGFKAVVWNLYLPMQLKDWLLIVAALLLIGQTQISLTKSDFKGIEQ